VDRDLVRARARERESPRLDVGDGHPVAGPAVRGLELAECAEIIGIEIEHGLPRGDGARAIRLELRDLDAQRLLVGGGRRQARRPREHVDQLGLAARRTEDPRELVERRAVRVVGISDLAPRGDRSLAVARALGDLRDLRERRAALRRIRDDGAALAKRIGERGRVTALAQDLDQIVERDQRVGLELEGGAV
jgi:hypothetical protein